MNKNKENKKEKNDKSLRSRFYQFGVLCVALLMIISAGVYATIYITEDGGIYTNDLNSLLIKSDNYIIYEDLGYYYSINGSSGLLLYKNSNFTKVFQDTVYMLNDTDGSSILIKAPKTESFYVVNKTILIPDSVDGLTIRGSGFMWNTGGVVLKPYSESVDPIIWNDAGGQTFFWIDKISFDADGYDITCLKVEGFDTKITSCSFVGVNATGIDVYTNVFIRDCWIENLNIGLDLYGQNDVFVNNNIFWDNKYDIQTSVGSTRLTVTENRFKDSDRVLRVSGNGLEHVIFSNNVMIDIEEYVFHFNAAKTNNISIIGNIVDGGGVTESFLRIESPRNASGMICDNIVYDLTGDFLLGDYSCLNDMMIINNIGHNNNSIINFIESDTEPVLRDNSTAYWYDTDDGYLYQIVNTYGDVYYLNYTTSI